MKKLRFLKNVMITIINSYLVIFNTKDFNFITTNSIQVLISHNYLYSTITLVKFLNIKYYS